jgi:hypothetical protein
MIYLHLEVTISIQTFQLLKYLVSKSLINFMERFDIRVKMIYLHSEVTISIQTFKLLKFVVSKGLINSIERFDTPIR